HSARAEALPLTLPSPDGRGFSPRAPAATVRARSSRGRRDFMSEQTLTARERRLSLGAVIGGVFGVGVAFGAMVPLISLLLGRRGIGATWIGLNAAMFPIAMILVGPLLPRVIGWLGTLRSMYLGIGVATGLILLFPLLPQVWVWFVLRFLVGVATGVHWVV